MNFVMEIGDQVLYFLDLTLTLSTHNSQMAVSFSIYRKDTYTGISIANDSMHPQQHKLAPVSHVIHRLLTIPLSDVDQLKEI